MCRLRPEDKLYKWLGHDLECTRSEDVWPKDAGVERLASRDATIVTEAMVDAEAAVGVHAAQAADIQSTEGSACGE